VRIRFGNTWYMKHTCHRWDMWHTWERLEMWACCTCGRDEIWGRTAQVWKKIHGHVTNVGEICGECRTNGRDKTDGPMMLIGMIIQVDMKAHVRQDRWVRGPRGRWYLCGICVTHKKRKMNSGYGRHDKNTALQFWKMSHLELCT
jgi:hypothetical protein